MGTDAQAPVSRVVNPLASREARDFRERVYHAGPPAFSIAAPDAHAMQRFVRANNYSAALAFLRGDVSVEGDLVAAIRWKAAQAHSGPRDWFWTAAAKIARAWASGRGHAASNIQFHYDRSNPF